MNIHKNARLTPLRREEMALAVIEGAVSKADAARIYGVSAKIVARWVERYRAEGSKGIADRSSRPNVMPGMTGAHIHLGARRRPRLWRKPLRHQFRVGPAAIDVFARRIDDAGQNQFAVIGGAMSSLVVMTAVLGVRLIWLPSQGRADEPQTDTGRKIL